MLGVKYRLCLTAYQWKCILISSFSILYRIFENVVMQYTSFGDRSNSSEQWNQRDDLIWLVSRPEFAEAPHSVLSKEGNPAGLFSSETGN